MKQIKIDYTASIAELKELYLTAKTAYYEDAAPLFSDMEFDKLEDHLKANVKEWANIVGAPVKTVKVRAQLPIPMFSLDKVKIDTVDKWLAQHKKKSLVLMDKLDGASVQLVYKAGKPVKAFTRGDGIEGGDISFLIPSMNIPKLTGDTRDFIVRMEALFSKQAFKKWDTEFKSDRNAVSGLLNNQVAQPALKDVDFVVLQVLDPSMSISLGLDWAAAQGFKIVDNVVCEATAVDQATLATMLSVRKELSKYRCDGIVIALDEANPLPTEDNPDWAVAFKKNDDAADAPKTKIIDILWEVSSHGYIIPKAKVEPVEFDGATVQYVSVKNARWMEANNIGIGAEIAIVRSGDIIPCIIGVITAAKKIQKPDAAVVGEYKWNDGGTDYILSDPEASPAYQVKRILRTFQTLDIDFMGEGNVQRLYEAGFTTANSIFKASVRDLMKADGIQLRGAQKIHDAIHKVIDNGVSMPMLMDASGAFPRGIGTRRAEMIGVAHDLDMLMSKSSAEIIATVSNVPQFEMKTAIMFESGVKGFKAWMKETGLTVAAPVKKVMKESTGALKDVKVTFTGYRNEDEEKHVEANGGEVISFGSKTTVLLYKAGGKKSSKLDKAAAKGITVMTWSEFKKMYKV